MKKPRGLALTFSTIIIIIVLVLTLVAILVFFQKGFEGTGGQVSDLSEGVGEEVSAPGRMNPAHWDFLCPNKFACVEEDESPKEDYAETRYEYEDCTNQCTGNKVCKCIGRQ